METIDKTDKFKNFDLQQQQFQQKGYKMEDKTFTMQQATNWTLMSLGPISVALLFLFLVIHGFDLDSFNTLTLLLLCIGLILSIVIHELLHGLGWGLFCEGKFNSISFGFDKKSKNPYCHCHEPLPFSAYVFGAFLPCLLLGIFPTVFAMVSGNFFLCFLGIINIFSAGGDLIIIWRARKYTKTYLLDHPEKPGFVVFSK